MGVASCGIEIKLGWLVHGACLRACVKMRLPVRSPCSNTRNSRREKCDALMMPWFPEPWVTARNIPLMRYGSREVESVYWVGAIAILSFASLSCCSGPEQQRIQSRGRRWTRWTCSGEKRSVPHPVVHWVVYAQGYEVAWSK